MPRATSARPSDCELARQDVLLGRIRPSMTPPELAAVVADIRAKAAAGALRLAAHRLRIRCLRRDHAHEQCCVFDVAAVVEAMAEAPK